jgi:putative addiction module killer protein
MADDVLQVLEYIDVAGKSPFAKWFDRLNPTAAAKVTIALYRLRQGNVSNVKGVGEGVFEYKIDFGPGYRIYFGKDGEPIVILLGGSDKKRQAVAIAAAKTDWASYRRRKPKTD